MRVFKMKNILISDRYNTHLAFTYRSETIKKSSEQKVQKSIKQVRYNNISFFQDCMSLFSNFFKSAETIRQEEEQARRKQRQREEELQRIRRMREQEERRKKKLQEEEAARKRNIERNKMEINYQTDKKDHLVHEVTEKATSSFALMKKIQVKEEHLNLQVQQINKMVDLKEIVDPDMGTMKVVLIGANYTGKTEFVNHQFGLNRQTSMYFQSDMKAELVCKTNVGVQLMEVSLVQEDLEYIKSDITVLKSLINAQRFVIFYEEALKTQANIVKLAANINKRAEIYMVRTKADLFEKGQARTVTEEMKIDEKILKQWKVTPIRMLKVSCRSNQPYDNKIVKDLLSKK